jgi:fused signal recognition particle receptor
MNVHGPWSTETLAIGGATAGILLLAAVAIFFRRRRARRFRSAHTIDGKGPPARALLRDGLGKTRQGLLSRLQGLWSADLGVEARLAELEEVLITADVGVTATRALLARLRLRLRELGDARTLRTVLREEMCAIIGGGSPVVAMGKPHVILVVGVNGVGKTTTIGKLAHRYRSAGQTVLLVAADTFRAAASEQLQLWARRVAADCVHHQHGADPSAVAYDGVAAAMARGVDVVIIDTAGRLHVKAHLVEELKKVARVIRRQLPDAPHEVLLVIDATTGQNAISQGRVFQEALAVTGIVLTKLDGTAKGGAALALRAELDVPICYIGVGEAADDLLPFDAAAFVDALLPEDEESPRASAA